MKVTWPLSVCQDIPQATARSRMIPYALLSTKGGPSGCSVAIETTVWSNLDTASDADYKTNRSRRIGIMKGI